MKQSLICLFKIRSSGEAYVTFKPIMLLSILYVGVSIFFLPYFMFITESAKLKTTEGKLQP